MDLSVLHVHCQPIRFKVGYTVMFLIVMCTYPERWYSLTSQIAVHCTVHNIHIESHTFQMNISNVEFVPDYPIPFPLESSRFSNYHQSLKCGCVHNE